VVIPACKGEDPSIGDGVFPGGHWHLEGMASERIAATGIYYYDMTNVQVIITYMKCTENKVLNIVVHILLRHD
jgi:Protein of unknown function (DUF4246)